MGNVQSRSSLRVQRWPVSQRPLCSGRLLAKRGVSGLVLLLILALSGVSKASVDLTGDWYVAYGFSDWPDIVPQSIVQTGNSLRIDVFGYSFSGYIDPSTGRFNLENLPSCYQWPCPFCSAWGQASVDGNTFAGEVYLFGPPPDCRSATCACDATYPVGPWYGSRSPCGDGIVDPGEACDDANLGRNADCCVLGCFPAPVGRGCTVDRNLCTSDVCDAAGTCTHPAGNAGTECRPAADLCDVAETCNGVDSDCPADAKQPNGAGCSDGQFCNGAETTCQAGVCQSGAAPCPLFCDEANDQCVTACPSAPETCRTAEKSLLVVKDKVHDGDDRLTWRWTRGAPTSQTEFGDPTATADYALCIYAGTAAALVGESVIPASAAKWSALSNKGYTYTDPAAAEGGIGKALLKKGSTQDKSKVVMRGKGAGLPDLPLPITAPVTVQLVNGDNGLCWGASYSGSQFLKNDAGQLKAKTP